MTKVIRKVGRPPKWASVDELIPLINDYFEITPREELTVTGLALAIGTSRKSLIEMTNRSEDFAEVILEAKTIIENAYEISLRRNGRSGDIFGLKNFGWIDRMENVNANFNAEVDPAAAAAKVDRMFIDEGKPKEDAKRIGDDEEN